MNSFTYHRQKAGLSQQEISNLFGIDQSTVSKWENGVAMPRANTLVALAKLYGCTVDALLSGEDENEKEKVV